MRSIVRAVTITGLVAASVSALAAQPGRRPIRPLPPEPPVRAEVREQVRERMLERREAMIERRAGMREGIRMGARMGGRAGFRAGERAGFRAGRMGMGPGRGGPGGRAGLRGARADGRRAVIRERINALKPAEREAMFRYRQSLSEERFRATEELRAGKLNREQMRERLTKWRDAHKPPVDLRKSPGGN